MVFKHCPDCGKHLDKKEIGDDGLVPYCLICKKPHFNFSYPCVLCLVASEENEIALIKQSYVSQHYVGVAGYVKQGETIEAAAKREVEEETGLAVTEVKYKYSYHREQNDLLMFCFVCRVVKSDFNISKEVDDANWFSINEAINLLAPGSAIQKLAREYLQSNP
jgi:NAD+ diphosphatase